MPKRRPFRGKARYVQPPREAIHRTLGGRLPQRLPDSEAALLLDYVLGKEKDLESTDPTSVAVWRAVKAEAWGGLLQLLEAQAVLKALGKTQEGDTQLLVFLLCNLTKTTGKWQDVKRMVISGQLVEHKTINFVFRLPDGQEWTPPEMVNASQDRDEGDNVTAGPGSAPDKLQG